MTQEAKPRRVKKRQIALVLLIGGLIFAFFSGIGDLVSFDRIYQNRAELFAWRDSWGWMAPVALGLAYAVMMAFSLPIGLWVTITSGFLFGTFVGGLTALCGATLGASSLYFLARTAVGDVLEERMGDKLGQFRRGFEADGLNYMLTLRLLPIMPFWMVNLGCALIGVDFRIFVIGSFFGMIPGSMILASVGAGLDSLFAQCDQLRANNPSAVCQAPGFSEIMTPTMLTALFGLAFLALLPVLYKRWKGTNSARS